MDIVCEVEIITLMKSDIFQLFAASLGFQVEDYTLWQNDAYNRCIISLPS